MERLPLTYDGFYYVLGMMLALLVDANLVALPVWAVLVAVPLAVVVAFNVGYHLVESRVGPGAADERLQGLVESSMAWGFVAFGVLLGVSAAGVSAAAHLDVLTAGVMAFVGVFTVSRLRQEYAA